MKQRFIYPGRLPGQNDILKRNQNVYIGKKKKLTGDICLLAKSAKLQVVEGPVIISMHWIEPNRRRDIDNICGAGQKFILDGLVLAKVLPDDSRRWVRGLVHRFPEPNKANPRVIVEIEEAEPDQSKDLTDRQKQIYTYIRKRIEGGMPPTLKDLMDEFDIKSTQGVRENLRLIQKKGYIVRKAGQARGLYLTEKLA
jgi:Holliday junction resolvase RusA-like endonuclease